MNAAQSIFAFRRPAAPGLLALALIAAYGNSFAGPFVFDDTKSIVGNPTLWRLWPLGGPLSPPADLGVAGRPVLNLSLAVNYALGGTQVWGYHALNLLIHLLAALTLFGIVRRTLVRLGSPGAAPALAGPDRQAPRWALARNPDRNAFLIALIWAVHPLQTASVTYVIERAESLMGLFYLLTLYAFIRFAEAGAGPGAAAKARGGWAALSVLSCLAGMATKEVMVTAPLLVFLYDRTFLSGSFRAAWRRHRFVHLGLAGTWALLADLMAGDPARGIGFGYGIGAWAYARTECAVVVRYLALALWPHPLVLDYNAPILTSAAAFPYAFLVALALAGTLVALWLRPALGFVGGWFFLLLAPTSSVIPVALQPMAENRLYLPLAAPVALAVAGLAAAAPRRVWAAGLAVAAAFAGLTIERNWDYRSEIGLWEDTVRKSPDNPRAQYNLATVLLKAGRAADSIGHFEEALRLKPDDPDALFNLGLALADAGRLPESITCYEAALQLRPDLAKVRNNLGIALARSGRREEAIAQFAAAVRLDPNDAEAQNNWGNALYELGRAEEASVHLAAAVQLQPAASRFRVRLAMALAQSGRTAESIAQFEEALRLNPKDASTHYDLGLVLRAAGRTTEAQAHFESAARLGAPP